MNKLEYLEDLIASGSNSTQVFEAARQYDIDNPVKTNDTQTQDATAVSTNDASDTGSQSKDGSSASQPTVSPGQVLSRPDGFEYKYEVDPNDPNQGVYFSRQTGSEDEWTNANENTSEAGNVAKASIANLFGHSSFGEKEQKQYFDNVEKLKELKEAKKEAIKQYEADNELGWLGMLQEGRWGEGISRALGEGAERIIEGADDSMDLLLEPIAGALDFAGIMDFSDYEDDSWDGINFDGVINSIITDYAIGDGAEAGAYGDQFDFAEETGDRIEAGLLSIGANMMVVPKLLSDTKKVIGDGIGKMLPQGAADFINGPVMANLMGPSFLAGKLAGQITTQKGLVEAGEEAYNVFSKKSNQLNMTLMDFNDVNMTATLGKAFDGDATAEQRLGAFLTGSARITSSALGSLPSVAQSMIPYVGIASIVAGEAAATNMESAKDGRPLDWQRLGHAYVIGASEGLLELVTKKIGGNMFKNLKGGSKEVIKKSLLEYGGQVLKEFGQEGLSEVATLLINQAADKIYKDEVDEWLPAWGEVIDTFMIGGVMGGGMSLAGAGGAVLRNTIQSRNIKNSMKISGETSLSSMFDGSINPLSEGGLSTEIARGAEDSTVAIERGPDGKPLAANEVMLKVKPDSGGSGNPLVDAKNVKPENIDAKQKTEGISETGFVDSKGNEQTETTNPLTSRKNIDENNTANANAKPVTDSKSTYTADERADAKHTVLTNPQTEMFLNTELKRKVASGEMTSTKAAEIKANFKAQQGVANRIAPIGYSGQDRQSVIKLSTERNQLTEKIKSVGDQSLTKPEQARIAEIDSQLETIPRTATQQGVINAQVEQDIAFTEKFGNIGKKDGEFKDFIGENKAVVTYNTTQEFMEATGSTDGNVDAFITPEGQIIINKQHMREAGAVGVGRHELLHKILKSQFSGKNGEKLKDQFLEVIKAQDPAGHKLLMDKINQIDPATGERVYSEQELKDAPDEYLAQYSSLLFEGKIPLETFVEKPTLVKKLGNFFSNIFADAANENPTGENVKASDVGFKDGKDLYDFVRAYAKDSESGKLSERSKQLAEQGKDINKSKNVKSKTVIKGDLDLKQKINNLVPSSVKTQQDFFNPKVFNKIFNDGKLDPLIQRYIRSKSSSGAQGDLNIRNVANRLMNFDPAKKRADGTTVGANAFFEFITSNTNFGKRDSNKQLVEKAKDLKRSRSLDGDLDLQIEGDAGKINTSEAAEKLTDLRKKGVMKNVSSEQVSELTTAIEQDIEGQDLTGKNYKNINPGQALANAWGKIFGLNPELLYQIGKPGTQKAGKDVSSKRSVAEGDNAAFAKLRTFLNANAQNLINVLPEGTTYDGKATGIPENVKNLFYTKNSKGKLVKRKNISPKEIKDAMAAPDGALYKSSQAQTIKGINKLFFKGLLNTTVTQSQLSKGKSPTEVAVNKEGSSKRAFSKTVTSTQNNQLTAIMALDGINSKGTANVTTYLRDKNLLTGDITVTESNRKARQLSVLESIKKGKIPGAALDLLGLGNFGAQRDEAANGDYYYTLDNGETIIGKATKVNGKQKYGAPRKNGKGRPKLFSRPTLESIEAAYPGEKVKLQAARGSLYYGKSDPAYETMMKVADANNSLYSPEIIDGFKSVQQIKIKKGEKLTTKDKLANKTQEKINQKALADFVEILDKRDDKGKLIIPLNDSALFVAQAYQGTASLIKISAPFVGVSDVFIKADPGTPQAKRSTDYIEEHSPPANAVGAAIIFGLATDTSTQIMKGVKDNFVQIQLSNHSDVRLDDAGLAKKLADGTNILTPNVGFLRLAEAGILTDSPIAINLNTIQDLNTGLDIATTMGYPLKGKFKTDPSSVKKQSQLMLEQARDPNIKFSRSVGRLNTYVNTVGAPIIQATKNNSNLFDGKVNTNMGIDQQIEVLENYDKTLKFSRSLNTKPCLLYTSDAADERIV